MTGRRRPRRLSKDEYDARLESALPARTYADLDQVVTGQAVGARLTAFDLARFADQHPMASEGIGKAARTLV